MYIYIYIYIYISLKRSDVIYAAMANKLPQSTKLKQPSGIRDSRGAAEFATAQRIVAMMRRRRNDYNVSSCFEWFN